MQQPTTLYQTGKNIINSPFVRFMNKIMSVLPEEVGIKNKTLSETARKQFRQNNKQAG